jgi:hypothetical protein
LQILSGKPLERTEDFSPRSDLSPRGAQETNMADVKLSITVNKPTISTFSVAGKTLSDVKKNLDARDEWGLYDATQNFKSSAKLDSAATLSASRWC